MTHAEESPPPDSRPPYDKVWPLLAAADSGYGLFTTDPDGNIVSWNQSAEAIFGWKESEILGRCCDILFTPEDQVTGQPARELGTAAREGIAPDIRWHQRRDGGRVFINGSVHPLLDNDGELTGFLKMGRDLTEQKLAEAALVEAREKYRMLFATIDEGFVFGQVIGSPDAILDFRFEAVNPAFERLTGCAPGALEGRTARETFPQLEDVWFDQMAEAGLRGRASDIEIETPAFGCWVAAHFSPFGLEGDGGVAIALREIGERKDKENDLGFLAVLAQDLLGMGEEEEAWSSVCQTVADHMRVGYCGLLQLAADRSELEVLYHWERREEASAGMDARQLLPLLGIADAETLGQLRVDDAEQMPPALKERLRSAGAHSCLVLSAHSAPRGGLLLLLADPRARHWSERDADLARGILARLSLGLEGARSSEALRRSEQRHRLMVENVHEYVLLSLDPEGHMTGWSAALQRLTGYSEQESVGHHFRLFYGQAEQAAGLPEEVLQRAAAEGWAEGEGWRRRKDGSRFWVNEVVSPLRDGRDKLLGFVQVARDLTEQRLAERELLERERETALLAERARLAQELHDSLAQVFVGIKLQIEMAAGALQKTSADLESANRHLERAREFALASQVEARNALRGLRLPVITNLPLGEALESLVQRCEGAGSISFHATGRALHLPAAIQHDLYRIAQEALTNAIRHSGAEEISLTLQQLKNRLVLTVVDDGKGFDPQSLAEGFGLTGIRERALRLKARLVLESSPEQGTTVEVSLGLKGLRGE